MPDSQLVMWQSTREFKAREGSMKQHQEKVQKRMMKFDEVTFQHTQEAKMKRKMPLPMALFAIIDLGKAIHFQQLHSPHIECGTILEINWSPSWMVPIKAFLEKGELLDNHLEAQKLEKWPQSFSCTKEISLENRLPNHTRTPSSISYNLKKLILPCWKSTKEFAKIMWQLGRWYIKPYAKNTISQPC